MTLRVQDIMSDQVQTVSPQTPAEEAWQLMRANGIHHLVVTDESEVAGVISDRGVGGSRGACTRRERVLPVQVVNVGRKWLICNGWKWQTFQTQVTGLRASWPPSVSAVLIWAGGHRRADRWCGAGPSVHASGSCCLGC